jgi:hypothetical protein
MAQRIADVQAGGLRWLVAERMARSWATPTPRNGACAMPNDFQSSRPFIWRRLLLGRALKTHSDEWTGHAAFCPLL